MAASKVALILGAGPNVGQHVARTFAAKGYKVASTSRSAKEENSTSDLIHIAADLANPESVLQVFSKVKASLGTPSVVVYNAAVVSFVDPKNPFTLSPADISKSININTTSVYTAVQQAVQGFEQLPESSSRSFIYTGNLLNTTVAPALLDLGIGKSGSAHLIQAAASAYGDKGFKFYYTDERKEDGAPIGQAINGDAHGEFYGELADSKTQLEWHQTFVKGVGYKKF